MWCLAVCENGQACSGKVVLIAVINTTLLQLQLNWLYCWPGLALTEILLATHFYQQLLHQF